MLNLERLNKEVRAPAAAPLHLKLRQALHAQITDGTLQPGESLPAERVLQEHLSVSRSTVRQAIGSLTQAGLLQSIPGAGTFVLARQDSSTQTGLVGLVVSSPNFHFFYPQLAAAFNTRLRQSGYRLVMSLHNDQADLLAEVVEDLIAQNVVAVALTPPRLGSADFIAARLRQRGIPLLFIGRRADGQTDCVATDNEQIGYQAAHHLIELGHRRIVHLGYLDYSTGQDRANGYCRAMTDAGLEPDVVEIPFAPQPAQGDGFHTDHLAERAYQTARTLWSKDLRPTSAFCFNDVVAMGTYKALRDLSLRVPQDVSLVSVDNLPTIRHFEVPLTTFTLPGEEIGRQSAELLMRRLGGEELPPQTRLLPGRFVKRFSTAPPHTA